MYSKKYFYDFYKNMLIYGINFKNNINLFTDLKTKNVRNHTFTPQLSFKNNGDIFERNPLNKFNSFTINEYKKLSSDEISKINKEIDKCTCQRYDEAVNMHNTVCDGIKSYLNKTYGKDNYTVLILGRSLSSIGKCLGYKIGEDNIKILPMSRAGRFCLNSDIDEDVKSLKNYLDSIGLSKESIEKNKKPIVLVDYSCTGGSLIGAKNILQRDDVLGNKTEIYTENVMDMVKGIDPDILKKYGFDSKKAFRFDAEFIFWNSLYKKYALVGRCTDLRKTQQSVLDLSKEPEYKKQFLFKLLDSYMRNVK